MTPFDVRRRVTEIAKLSDNEEAHSAEDDLYVDVLRAVANGDAEDSAACAAAALEARELDFTRWYA